MAAAHALARLAFTSLVLAGAECPEGTVGQSPDKCSPCQLGEYNPERGKACEQCPAGKFGGNQGASACEDCPAGTYLEEKGSIDANQCRNCSAGRWSSETGLSEPGLCKRCPEGKWGTAPGASSEHMCTGCGPGKYINASAGVCQDCPPGRWSDQTNAKSDLNCVACAAGRYSSEPGATAASSCRDCPSSAQNTMVGIAAEAFCFSSTTTTSTAPPAKPTAPPAAEAGAPEAQSGASRRVTMRILNLNLEDLKASFAKEEGRLEDLKTSFAKDIAAALSVSQGAISDLEGNPSSVSFVGAQDVAGRRLAMGAFLPVSFLVGGMSSEATDDKVSDALGHPSLVKSLASSVEKVLGLTGYRAMGGQLEVSDIVVSEGSPEGMSSKVSMLLILGVIGVLAVGAVVLGWTCMGKRFGIGKGEKASWRRRQGRGSGADSQSMDSPTSDTDEGLPLLMPVELQSPPISPPQSPPARALSPTPLGTGNLASSPVGLLGTLQVLNPLVQHGPPMSPPQQQLPGSASFAASASFAPSPSMSQPWPMPGHMSFAEPMQLPSQGRISMNH